MAKAVTSQEPSAIGIDIGTSNTKVVLASPTGPMKVLSAATPSDPAALSKLVITSIAALVADAPTVPQAIGIASMAESGWALDADDAPASDIWRWDTPRHDQAMTTLARTVGPEMLFDITGVRPGPKPPLTLWLDAQAHNLVDMSRWAGVADGIHLALTGRLRTDHTLAGRTLAYRLPPAGQPLPRTFDQDLLAPAYLLPEQLPAVGLPGDPLDGLTPDVNVRSRLRR